MTQEQIMKNWYMKNADVPLVSVICCTYNHEKYISDAIEGFLKQKTTFPFEVLVNDDASTDGTAAILHRYEKNYPNILKIFYHEINEYSQGVDIFGNLVRTARGKYIAICEGDDYWIDSDKLQLQVNFLEKNPDYGMCYGRVKRYIQRKERFCHSKFGAQIKGFEDLLKNGNRIPTLTVCARRELIDRYNEEIKPAEKHWLMGDYPMWLYIAHESKTKFFQKDFAVYRILSESASHSENPEKRIEFEKSIINMKLFFYKSYSPFPFYQKQEYFRIYALYYYLYGKKEYLSEMQFLYKSLKTPTTLDKFYINICRLPYPLYFFFYALKEIAKKVF
ncbi:MAG: glycosyltransferase [Treponema sp.]|nr:glycosyltransferase [Treponema sp.]